MLGRQMGASGQQPSMHSCQAGVMAVLGGGQGVASCLCSTHLQTTLTHQCHEKANETCRMSQAMPRGGVETMFRSVVFPNC